MVGVSLLHSDDDSDVPDLDLGGSSMRRSFFNKNGDADYTEIRHRRKTYKKIFSIVFGIGCVFVLYFLYKTLSQMKNINEQLKDLHQTAQKIDDIQIELAKLRMEIDIFHESSNRHSNQTKPTTDLIYDKLYNITSKLDVLNDGYHKNILSMDDVTSRMSRVENKCLAVCQHDSDMIRKEQQPRRRQTATEKKKKVTGGDEIVFRRND